MPTPHSRPDMVDFLFWDPERRRWAKVALTLGQHRRRCLLGKIFGGEYSNKADSDTGTNVSTPGVRKVPPVCTGKASVNLTII